MGRGKRTASSTDDTQEDINSLIQDTLNRILPGIIQNAIAPFVERLENYQKLYHAMKVRLDSLENQLVSDQIEIANVPVTTGENTDDLARKVLQKLNLDETNVQTGVLHSYRLPKVNSQSTKPPKIIVKLANSSLRRLAHSNRIKHPITQEDLALDGNGRVFVNERLRPELRQSFHKLLELKRQKKIQTVWSHNQRIMVKVSKDDDPEPVDNLQEFLNSLD
jgi:hypothetical protein